MPHSLASQQPFVTAQWLFPTSQMGHLLGSFQVAASEANTGGLCGRPAAGFKGFDEQGAIVIND